MSIFDNVLENVKNVADAFGKTANKVVDVSKLKLSMNEVNAEIKKRTADLGEYIYNAKKSGDFSEADLTEKIAEIDDLYEQLSELSKGISTLRNKAICPECGKEVSLDAAYCSACGAKLPEREIPAVEEEPAAEETVEETEPAEEDYAAECEAEEVPAADEEPANEVPVCEEAPVSEPAEDPQIEE